MQIIPLSVQVWFFFWSMLRYLFVMEYNLAPSEQGDATALGAQQ